MKRYNVHVIDNHKYVDETSAGRYVDAEIAQEIYETIAEIASLYKSDVVPSDDFCWDEVVEMCRKAKKKADED